MALEALVALSETIEKIQHDVATDISQITEADAKTAWITPILSMLGWQGLRRLRSEYQVVNSRERLDYALIGLDDRPIALIEAKKPRETLDRHVTQVLGYAFQEGVSLCVLTTGVKWWFYLPRERGNPTDRRFAELDLQHDNAAAALLERYLSYEALTSGTAERRAKEALIARQIEQIWQRLIGGPAASLVALIQEEVRTAFGSVPTDEQVAEHLTRAASAPSTAEAAKTSASPSPQPGAAAAELQQAPAQTVEPTARRRGSRAPKAPVYGYRLFGGELRRVVSWVDLWKGTVDDLYSRFGDEEEFLKRVSSSSMLMGRQKTYFGRSNDGIRKSYRLASGKLWIECNFSSKDIVQRSHELIRVLGYAPDDLEIVRELPSWSR